MRKWPIWSAVALISASAFMGGHAADFRRPYKPVQAIEATGSPGHLGFWTTGDKQGIGTAFYDRSLGVSRSNIWFTLANGGLSEVYYPDVSTPDLASLQFVVTNGNHTMTEKDMKHSIDLLSSRALLYRQVNQAMNGQISIAKTYVADPSHNALVMHVRVNSAEQPLKDYGLYLYELPHIHNDAANNTGTSWQVNGHKFLIAHRNGIYQAVTATSPFSELSTGYYGSSSDPIVQLQAYHRLSQMYRQATQGTIAQVAEIQTPRGLFNDQHEMTFDVAVGYGNSQAAAVSAAESALGQSFTQLQESYVKGWEGYLRRLKPAQVGSKMEYNVAIMTTKAMEDKRHPGAFAASLTIPWGQNVVANLPDVGGYHLIWPRDLYEMASALYAVGDRASMQEALDYLAAIQDQNGSFPQNVWVDGTPFWPGLQMDEVSYPVIMAYQLDERSLYRKMVVPAADYLVQHGPSTEEERWEETGGYSPSTMAAEIAALVCAGTMAEQANDLRRAELYLSTADKYRRDVMAYTVVTNGPESSRPYFLRISASKNPNDKGLLYLANQAGVHPKSTVVDAGFLELVRLGVLSANNPLIDNSVNVVDHAIGAVTPIGPMWKRYTFDGYGQKQNGQPYDGSGTGWYWPVFDGERGEFMVAAMAEHVQPDITNHYSARSLLKVMAQSANSGEMIPEQTWNGKPFPKLGLIPGGPTGSANPLGWAMAQYVRLEADIAAGQVLDMPRCVAQRYLSLP